MTLNYFFFNCGPATEIEILAKQSSLLTLTMADYFGKIITISVYNAPVTYICCCTWA